MPRRICECDHPLLDPETGSDFWCGHVRDPLAASTALYRELRERYLDVGARPLTIPLRDDRMAVTA